MLPNRRPLSALNGPRLGGIAALGALGLTTLLVWAPSGPPARASAQANPTPTLPAPHFRLPFDGPPGPSTWLLNQFYGNTSVAYSRRESWYDNGEGLHFGVDFSAPCGTPVHAIGDGQVIERDNLLHGSAPHNLVILHPSGYASFYGHLLDKAIVRVGDEVKAGQVVAYSGDPDLTCHSRPHLHLEIRDRSLGYTFNPVPLIDADWDSLTLFGPSRPLFRTDLDNPHRWQSPFDQPEVHFGGPMLNDYRHPWPPKGW